MDVLDRSWGSRPLNPLTSAATSNALWGRANVEISFQICIALMDVLDRSWGSRPLNPLTSAAPAHEKQQTCITHIYLQMG